VLLWFVIVAPVLVAEVFKSPLVDYRLVALGATLPVIELLVGRPFVLHTFAAPVVLLTVVMAATTGRRLLRRRLLGVPIGLFLHQVLDATWSEAALFWWPLFGFSFADLTVPELQRPLLSLTLDLVAVIVALVVWRRYELDRPENRTRLVRTGHLSSAVRRI
jgi:hypothetical protein